MARQAEKEQKDGPYSIRWLDAACKRDALAASKRADLDVGEWWAMACRTQLAYERGDLVRRGADDGVVESQAMTLIDPGTPERFSIDEMSRVVDIACNIANLRGKLSERAIGAMLAKVVERLGISAEEIGERPISRAQKALGADVG